MLSKSKILIQAKFKEFRMLCIFRTFEIIDFDAPKTKHSKTYGFRCVKHNVFDSFRRPQKLKLAKLKFCVLQKSKPTKIFDFCGVKIKDFDRFF